MSYKIAEYRTKSPRDTEFLGIRLARWLTIPSVVLLQGALGTGKTTLARGIALGCGLKDASLVNSPSFTLVNIYHARCPVYHVDLYRLKSPRDLYSIGLDDFIGKDGVTIVEWSDRLSFPAETAVRVVLEDAGDDLRVIRISGAREFPGVRRRRIPSHRRGKK